MQSGHIYQRMLSILECLWWFPGTLGNSLGRRSGWVWCPGDRRCLLGSLWGGLDSGGRLREIFGYWLAIWGKLTHSLIQHSCHGMELCQFLQQQFWLIQIKPHFPIGQFKASCFKILQNHHVIIMIVDTENPWDLLIFRLKMIEEFQLVSKMIFIFFHVVKWLDCENCLIGRELECFAGAVGKLCSWFIWLYTLWDTIRDQCWMLKVGPLEIVESFLNCANDQAIWSLLVL